MMAILFPSFPFATALNLSGKYADFLTFPEYMRVKCKTLGNHIQDNSTLGNGFLDKVLDSQAWSEAHICHSEIGEHKWLHPMGGLAS